MQPHYFVHLPTLSHVTHISISQLSRVLRGKSRLSMDRLPLLAGAMGISVDELIDAIQDNRIKAGKATNENQT